MDIEVGIDFKENLLPCAIISLWDFVVTILISRTRLLLLLIE